MSDRLGYCHCYKIFDRGKKGITKVLTMISITVVAKLRINPKPGSTCDILGRKKNQYHVENAKRILVPIDGQLQSLKALNGAVILFKDMAKTRTLLLNVIEWTDDEDESLDGIND